MASHYCGHNPKVNLGVNVVVSLVIVVFLRQPRVGNQNERRDDPFWEFGSFGCTGCHRKNLMNPAKSSELNGVRLAFVQGGPKGVKLVHVTPPISVRQHGSVCEAKWQPVEMPLTYTSAPIVVNNDGYSDIPLLADQTRHIRRSTPVSRFTSGFRTRRLPLPSDCGLQVIRAYKRFRAKCAKVAGSYVDAMPYPPSIIERNRKKRYSKFFIC
jgi:hypothetical protein